MKLPEPNKRTRPDKRGAPEYYTLKEAVEVLEIVCQRRDLSESDAAALASGLGITFHVVARPIAMGDSDTLIIPPYPRPNNAPKLHWMDLQRLIDHCAENPQFVKDIRQIGTVDKEKDRIELGEIKGQSIAKAEKDIKPIKGKPETLRKWMNNFITVEKGLSLSDEMPDGLQAELIREAATYGYRDPTSVKTAWSKLGLISVRKTTRMRKPPKTP